MTMIICAVLLALCDTAGILLRYAPFAPVVTPRQRKVLLITYSVFSAVNLVVLLALFSFWGMEGVFAHLRFGMILYSAVLTVVNILVIREKTREHLFVFGVVCTCKYLLLAVPNYLITLVQVMSAEAYLYLILIAYTVLLVATYFPLRTLLCSTVTPILYLVDGTYWNTIWFIPIALFGSRFLFAGGEHNSGGLLQLLSSGLSGAIIILMCLSISQDHQRLRERQNLQQQLLNQKIHYSELQTRAEDARKTRHDLKHHLAAILHFVELNDRDGARNYCLELMGRVDGRDWIPYTGNTAVDGVLYYYMQQAAEHKIDFQSVGVVQNPGIADIDLCVLLGNALDNALAGCMTIPERRSIQVVSQSENQLLSILVRNTFDGKLEQSEEGLLSRKRHKTVGVGIHSMEAVCQQYGGSMEIQYDDTTFTVMFVLPLSGE